jgi:hypothetical protein
LVAEVTEMLPVNTCALQTFGIERYNLKKLNAVDIKNRSKFQTGLQLSKT